LLSGSREHLPDRFPESQGAVLDGQHRGGHAAAATIAQQISPRLSRFAIAVGEGDEFLAAISTHPEHHQQTELFLLEADFEVNPVHPQVDVVGARQISLTERPRFVLPLAGQPGDRGGREPDTRAKELLQGRTEVAGRQTTQIQQRQHLGHLR